MTNHPEMPGKHHESGAAMVEAALILPLLLALLLGMVTFGDAYFTRISIEDAVRDGARYGSSMATFDETSVKQRVVDLSGGELSIADVCAKKVTAGSGAPGCGLSDPVGATGELVEVRASTSAKIEVIFFSRTIALDAEATAPYERS